MTNTLIHYKVDYNYFVFLKREGMKMNICKLCGTVYTEQEGHNKQDCIEKCEENLQNADNNLVLAEQAVELAKKRLEQAKNKPY